MFSFRHGAAVGALLLAAAAGCGDNTAVPSVISKAGQIEVDVLASPADVSSIHITVTGADFAGSVDTDLVQQVDGSWLGTVLDVPPGAGRTVTADGYDPDSVNTFEGTASNVTVVAGKLTDIDVTLTPVGSGSLPGANTPPEFVSMRFPDAILSDQTATLFATAADPDANTELTYSWSSLQGGGTFSNDVISNQTPGVGVSTVYTPVLGFTGFSVIQASVTDGTATTTTTFPIAIGAGLVPDISFDVLPDLTISSVQRQILMPGGTTQIQYALTNPVQSWTPATMHVHTSWSDSCGGTFDAAPEDLDIDQGDTASRTVTYTAPSSRPSSVTSCQLGLTMVDTNSVQSTTTVNTWIQPPMVMFESSVAVAGNAFNGQWQTADAFCQDLADAPTAATPPGIYHAMISFDEIDTKDRMLDAPFIRIDGTPIARNKAELFSIDLLNSILVNENSAFTGVSAVYTGTNGDGTKGTNCLNWTSTDGGDNANAGINATSASPNWTTSGTFTCSAQLPIYCVQQPENDPR